MQNELKQQLKPLLCDAASVNARLTSECDTQLLMQVLRLLRELKFLVQSELLSSANLSNTILENVATADGHVEKY